MWELSQKENSKNSLFIYFLKNQQNNKLELISIFDLVKSCNCDHVECLNMTQKQELDW